MGLSKRNKRGVISLFVAMLLIAVLPRLYATYFASEELNVDLLESAASYQFPEKKVQPYSRKYVPKIKFKKPKKAFDPNLYGIDDWRKLGLSKRQAEVVFKFCERGVYDFSDVQRIFVIPSELQLLIKDSLNFPPRPQSTYKGQHARAFIRIELNTADTAELVQIPGIGDYFAAKIIGYRNRLGGYYRAEQLMEVYKMNTELYEKILPHVLIDTMHIKKIQLNTADYSTLKAHPYIKHQVANSIVKMRQQRGSFTSPDELKKSKVISDSLFLKIKPYVEL